MFLVKQVGAAQSFAATNKSTGEPFTAIKYPVSLHPFTEVNGSIDIAFETKFTLWLSDKKVAEFLSDKCWGSDSKEIAVLDPKGHQRGELKRVSYKTQSGEERNEIQATVWFDKSQPLCWGKIERPASSERGNLFEVFSRPNVKEGPVWASVDITENPFD